jgi:hypothetical protein
MKLSDIHLYDPEVFAERMPYEWFDFLRANAPVHRFEDPLSGVPFWAVTRHADVIEVSRHPEIFSSFDRTSLFREPVLENDLEEQQLMLVNQDPPEHTRLRSIVNKGFTPRMVSRLEARIREYADEIVDRALTKGTGDFVEMVSAELPLEVIAEIMGAPLEERGRIFDLSNRLIGFDDPEFQNTPRTPASRRPRCTCSPTTCASSVNRTRRTTSSPGWRRPRWTGTAWTPWSSTSSSCSWRWRATKPRATPSVTACRRCSTTPISGSASWPTQKGCRRRWPTRSSAGPLP